MADCKVAVITAGGSGLGAGAARALAQEGFKISVLSPSINSKILAEEFGGIGVIGSNQSLDDLQKLIALTINKWGRIDVLINSAGHGPKGDLLDISDEEWHSSLDYYLLNVIRPSRLVVPIMEKQRGGTIINISSFAAFEPDPQFATSSVCRAGLASFTKLFSDKYARLNIRMNNLLPGFFDSLPEHVERLNRIPMGRYGKVEEFASMVAYLSSEKASYITGQNIRIDGGLTRSV